MSGTGTAARPWADGAEHAAVTFERERPYLLSAAYRLTSSWADAEDAVARAWPRWAEAAPGVEHPRAWLTTAVGRQSLDHLRAAHTRRERYVGPWLPEPLVTAAAPVAGPVAAAPDPLDLVVRDESVRTAFLVVLDTLTPEQRVAFVLHDVLQVPFGEIAEVLGSSPAAARQHASRARRRVEEAAPPPRAPAAEHAELLARLGAALAAGDVPGIAALLAPDVVAVNDGGGLVSAARRPVRGQDAVARFLAGLAHRWQVEVEYRTVLVNGDLGLRTRVGFLAPGKPRDAVYSFAVRDGRIAAVYGVLTPEKLPPG